MRQHQVQLLPPTFTDALGIEFRDLPAGSFLMGSPDLEAGRDEDEDQHEVQIVGISRMAVTPITQAQWMRVMGSNPSRFMGDNLPVDSVSWYEAVDFCKRLTSTSDGLYRLPHEAEWEYACRAGSSTAFFCGEEMPSQSGNVDMSVHHGRAADRRTSVVRRYAPNAWGMFDMHGNVWEWCGDYYGGYSSNGDANPQGPLYGSYRVVRGGAWDLGTSWARSASRCAATPDRVMEYGASGFRVVREH